MGLAEDDRLKVLVHDLGNLLGVVLNYGTLASRCPVEQAVADDIEMMRSAAARAAELVRCLSQWTTDPGRPDTSGGVDA